MKVKCWRCGGREKPFYALRTSDHFAGRICRLCALSFEAWRVEGVTRPSVTAVGVVVPPGTSDFYIRFAAEGEEQKKPQPPEYKKPEKGKRVYRKSKETLEDKCARLRKKWGTGPTKAELIEDDLYREES